MAIDMRSTWRGLLHFRPFAGKVNYAISFKRFGRAWCEVWTPKWHERRGPYVSIGLFFVAFYRGY